VRIGFNFFTFDECISGVEYYFLGLLRALLSIDSGDEYVVFTNQAAMIGKYVPENRAMALVQTAYIRNRLTRIAWEHALLPRKLARHAVDVLHCPAYICPFWKAVVPYVVTLHDTIALDHPGWCKRSNALYFNLLMKHTTKIASRVVSVSHTTSDDLMRNIGIDASRINTVYPGVDRVFTPDKDRDHCALVKNKYELPDKYILYIGNIEPKKNVLTLLQVAAELKKRGFERTLVLVGKRSWRAQAEFAAITRAVKAKELTVTGYVDRRDLPCVYQMADVFVFPSLYEGFGFPPLEAMACGVPVVTSACGALRETVKSAACIIEPHNVQQIADAVVSISRDSKLRDRLIRAGLEQAKRFTWKKTAEATLAIYRDVIAAPN